MKESKYLIGATWEYVDPISGAKGHIWFDGYSYGKEVWRWSYSLSDGSGSKFDYCFSYAAAKKDIPHCGRFKRVK